MSPTVGIRSGRKTETPKYANMGFVDYSQDHFDTLSSISVSELQKFRQEWINGCNGLLVSRGSAPTYRPSTFYDGGTDERADVERKSVWRDVYSNCVRTGCDPILLLRNLFANWIGDGFPNVRSVYTKPNVDSFIDYAKTKKIEAGYLHRNDPVNFRTQLRTEEFATPNPQDAVRAVVCSPYCGVSALFRYLMARRYKLTEEAEKLFHDAATQFRFAPEIYTTAEWRVWITDADLDRLNGK